LKGGCKKGSCSFAYEKLGGKTVAEKRGRRQEGVRETVGSRGTVQKLKEASECERMRAGEAVGSAAKVFQTRNEPNRTAIARSKNYQQ